MHRNIILLLMLCVDCLWAAQFISRYSCNPAATWNCVGYWVYLPNSYNPASSTLHPTIVTLHGIGEQGNGTAPDINKLKNAGIPKYIANNQWNTAWDFIVIAPQDFNGWWNQARATNVLQIAVHDYPKIDQKRIYLTGYSAGGGGVWDYAGYGTAQAGYVAAIAPICGTGSASTAPASGVTAMVQSKLPVWAFHNSGDPTVNVAVTNVWINALNAATINPAAQKTIYTSNSHDAWTATYNPATSPVYAWFLTHSRA